MRCKREWICIGKHPYKIWEGKNGKWYTYLQDDRKKEISVQTYNRYEADFNSCLKNTSLCKKKLKDVDENFLEDYIKTMIAQKELTAKKWSNIRIIIKGAFRYAKSNGYSDLHVNQFLNEIEISSKAFKKTYRSADELVFNHDEIVMVKQYIDNAKSSIINQGI